MKRRMALITGSLLLLGVVVAVMWLRGAAVPPPEPVKPEPISRSAPASPDELAIVAAEDARRATVAAAYAELQSSRKALQQQLSDLKARLWGRELPADQARSVSRDMMSAQYLLKNPAQLGAFSDADGVFAQKNKVDAARVRLQEVNRSLDETLAP